MIRYDRRHGRAPIRFGLAHARHVQSAVFADSPTSNVHSAAQASGDLELLPWGLLVES
jgi:hypothetical protein